MVHHELSIHELTKVFETDHGPITAVNGVSFRISDDEFFTMLGPSGCGKTTTLRMIAGLETITSGRIFFDGQDFTRFSSFQRNIGMVFQSYALYPHLTVFENAAYGLRIRKLPEKAVRSKVSAILELLDLRELAHRYPPNLSGGQQQRVSIARALVYDPGMLLLDEPLANLDAKLRVEMREEIRRIQKDLEIMVVYVTHDQEEAISVSDRLAVLNHGRLMQVDTPQNVYANPTSLFVADFIGKANFFPARILSRNSSGARVVFAGCREVDLTRLHPVPKEEVEKIKDGFEALIMIRPEHLNLSTMSEGGIPCRLRRIQFLGSVIRYLVHCDAASSEVIVEAPRYVSGIQEGGEAWLTLNPADAILFYRGGTS